MSELFGSSIFGNFFQAAPIIVALIIAGLGLFARYLKKEKQQSIGVAFKDTVARLSSEKNEERMASAILLRRFLDKNSEYGVAIIPFLINTAPFAKTTVCVIAAVLKTSQTSDFQKVLSDSLRYAPKRCLMGSDFQRANLSKAYLGGQDVNLTKADFFQANLSGTTLKHAVLNGAQFYEAILNGTKFRGAKLRDSNFNYAVLHKVDFRDADLTGANFEHASIREVDFTGAILKDARFDNALGYGNQNAPACLNPPKHVGATSKKVFISRPGLLDARQRLIIDGVKTIVNNRGYTSVEMIREEYDVSNVLSKVCDKIDNCAAMIVFGFKSIHVVEGVMRYCTEDTRDLKHEFFSTPWNHIEVGMSIMKRIPILLLVDDGINDGVFDSSINDHLLTKFAMEECLDDRNNYVSNWMDANIADYKLPHDKVLSKAL